jgi:hypothetical protein
VVNESHRATTISIDPLPDKPELDRATRNRLCSDFARFAAGLPDQLEGYLLDAYQLDISSTYGGIPIKNPWGKASGQLSMTAQQVVQDGEAGLGFCVLKTVIAQDTAGDQSMRAWAIPEARMALERIRGQTGREGWTVSWLGRGWSRSLDEYLELVREARSIGHAAGMLVVPSCKYHLPTPGEPRWKTDEYAFTTRAILGAYAADGVGEPAMPIEKDFSPTLAGCEMAQQRGQILQWLRTIPRLIRDAAGRARVRVGLKLFNALFDDEFQLTMLDAVACAGDDRPDFVIYANRLFDPGREFDGQRGIAAGGPDLSDRNLRVLAEHQSRVRAMPHAGPLEVSATGDISSGKMAVEYLRRGCSSFQLHTFFQLPASEYPMRHGSKIAKALHMLYFEPDTGLIAWLLHMAARLGYSPGMMVRLRDLVGRNPEQAGGGTG